MTDTSPPVVGSGNVAIRLGDQELFLVPSLNAARIISRNYQGVRGAVAAVTAWDIDAICKVVSAGLGEKKVRELGGEEALATKIWEAGNFDNTPGENIAKCIEFLHVLNRGGRPLPPPAVAGTEGGDTKDPQKAA